MYPHVPKNNLSSLHLLWVFSNSISLRFKCAWLQGAGHCIFWYSSSESCLLQTLCWRNWKFGCKFWWKAVYFGRTLNLLKPRWFALLLRLFFWLGFDVLLTVRNISQFHFSTLCISLVESVSPLERLELARSQTDRRGLLHTKCQFIGRGSSILSFTNSASILKFFF